MVTLLWLNDFAAEYGLGLLVVVGVLSLLFRDTRSLVIYGAATLLAVAWASVSAETPGTHAALFWSYLLLFSVLFYVVARTRLRAERELATSEARYALSAQGANDGLWDWDLLAGTLYLSPRWKEMIGFLDHEIDATPVEWVERIHPDDRARVHADLFRRVASSRLFESEHRIVHRAQPLARAHELPPLADGADHSIEKRDVAPNQTLDHDLDRVQLGLLGEQEGAGQRMWVCSIVDAAE
jgi:PAS domain-containing protein